MCVCVCIQNVHAKRCFAFDLRCRIVFGSAKTAKKEMIRVFFCLFVLISSLKYSFKWWFAMRNQLWKFVFAIILCLECSTINKMSSENDSKYKQISATAIAGKIRTKDKLNVCKNSNSNSNWFCVLLCVTQLFRLPNFIRLSYRCDRICPKCVCNEGINCERRYLVIFIFLKRDKMMENTRLGIISFEM